MTSDSGATRQDTDYPRDIPAALHALHPLQQTPRLVTSPDALETLARAIRPCPDRLGSFWGGPHRQRAWDAAALQAEPEQRVRQWPTPRKPEGRVQGGMRTAQGHTVPGWGTSCRRKGQRRAGKRDAGVYAGLVLLGMDERCPPALAAEVSLLAAMVGSVDEAPAVLAARGLA
jgi:hypothetical protein